MKITIIILSIASSLSLLAKIKLGDSTGSIYSLDDRKLISTESDSNLKTLSKSVGLIFYQDDLIEKDDLSAILFSNLLKDKPPTGSNYCSTEKFAEHHAYKKACTGFLIAKDLLVTAGHCFRSKNDCHRKQIAFDVTFDTENEKGFTVQKNNIYSCDKILAQGQDSAGTKLDYAVIILDRKVDNRPLLKFRQAKKVNNNSKLFMIGHPLGLPLIYSPNATVLENESDVYFKASLDSFHGNSGSPVFNTETNLVEGVLVSGEIDEIYDYDLKCNKYAYYDETDASRGEGVTRITAILPFIYNRLQEEQLIENF